MASRSLGVLTLDLIAKIGGFEAGMDKAGRKSKETADSIKASMGTIGTVLGGVAVAAAGTAAAMIKSSIDTADAANKQAQKIGITVESLTALQYAAELADIGNEEFAASMIKLDKTIRDAGEGSEKAADAFKTIGVAAENSDGTLRKADEVLLDIAEHFGEIPDGAQKAALAQDIFGKSGAQLIPLLNSGAAGIRELTDEAERMGIVISGDAARSAEEFNDNLTKLQKSASAFGVSASRSLLPSLTKITQEMIEAQKQSGLLNALLVGLTTAGGQAFGFEKKSAELFALDENIKRLNEDLETSEKINEGGFVEKLLSGYSPEKFAENTKAIKEKLRELNEERKKLLEPPRAEVNPLQSLSGGAAALEAQAKSTYETASKVIDASEKFREAAIRAEEARKQSILDSIDALEKEAKTWGMSADEVKLYDLAVLGATDAQKKHAASVLQTIDSLEAQKKATDDYKALLSDLRTDEEKLTDQMRERLDVLDKMSDLQGDERTKVASRIVGDATTEAPNFEGLAPEVGGAGGELEKINQAEKDLNAWYEKQLEMVKSFREEKAENAAAADAEELELKQQHEDKMAAIEHARYRAGLDVASEIFGNLEVLMQSKNKNLVRIGKAAATAQAIVSGATAFMNALAIPPYPLGLALAATSAVATAAQIATINGVGFKSGGYTGDMGVNEVAGQVHGKEFVMDARATARIGRANLEAMRTGKVDRNVASINAGSGSQRAPISMTNHFDFSGMSNTGDSRKAAGQVQRDVSRAIAAATRYS